MAWAFWCLTSCDFQNIPAVAGHSSFPSNITVVSFKNRSLVPTLWRLQDWPKDLVDSVKAEPRSAAKGPKAPGTAAANS